MSTETLPASAGRPTLYSPELRDKICSLLASGMTLRAICRMDEMPERQTIYNWLYGNIGERKDEEGKVIEQGFFDHYTRAREIGLDEVADETIEIADDGRNDWMQVEIRKGTFKPILDKEAVLRSKLRVDTRQKYLENMAPRKYGNRVKVENQQLDGKGEPTDPAGAISNEALDGFLKDIADAIEKAKPKDD